MLNSPQPNSNASAQDEPVRIRQRKTVCERPLLGAPSLGFELRNHSSAFLEKLQFSLREIERAPDRRDASRALLGLQQVYKRGAQLHHIIPAELHQKVQDQLSRVGLRAKPQSSRPAPVYPAGIREKLDRVLGIVPSA